MFLEKEHKAYANISEGYFSDHLKDYRPYTMLANRNSLLLAANIQVWQHTVYKQAVV